jgi:hypothetical protein
MMQRACPEPEYVAGLRYCFDNIWAFFVFSKPIDNDCAAVRKDGLDSKFATNRVDVRQPERQTPQGYPKEPNGGRP